MVSCGREDGDQAGSDSGGGRKPRQREKEERELVTEKN